MKNRSSVLIVHIPNIKLALALALLASCSKDTGLSERIEKLAANNVGRSVDMRIAAPFAWDNVAVFGAYYPKRDVCKELKLSAWGCFWLSYPEPADNSPSLIVFLDKGELTATALLPRCKIDVGLHGGANAQRSSTRFISSRDEAGCKQGGHRLTQE